MTVPLPTTLPALAVPLPALPMALTVPWTPFWATKFNLEVPPLIRPPLRPLVAEDFTSLPFSLSFLFVVGMFNDGSGAANNAEDTKEDRGCAAPFFRVVGVGMMGATTSAGGATILLLLLLVPAAARLLRRAFGLVGILVVLVVDSLNGILYFL